MEQVIFECDMGANGFPVAYHTVDIDDAKVIEALTDLASGKTDKKQAGWLEATSLPGQPDGATRWDALMAQSRKAKYKDKLAPIVAAIPQANG